MIITDLNDALCFKYTSHSYITIEIVSPANMKRVKKRPYQTIVFSFGFCRL